jgi:hypothetical protein
MGTPSLSRSQKGVYIPLKVCVRDTPDLPVHVFGPSIKRLFKRGSVPPRCTLGSAVCLSFS